MKNCAKLLSVFILSVVMLISTIACGKTDNSSQSSNSGNSSAENSSVVSSSKTQSSAQASEAVSSAIEFKPAVLDLFTTEWTQPETNYEEATTETTLFLVGDSTVCNYSEASENNARYYMRNGYGMRIGEYLNDKVTINNLALSGRSSKSFLLEGNYNTLKTSIKAGDYLIIGFGHNDQKTDKYTNPNGDVTDPTSFKYHLYEYYVKVAQDAGATPVLCTPIVRRSSSGVYSGSKIHQTNDQTLNGTTYPGGDYSKAIIELGAEKGITVIDLTTLTKNLLSGLSSDKSASLYSWYKYRNTNPSTAVDDTHVNAYGARIIARLICEELVKTDCTLKNYVKKEFAVPTADDVLIPRGFDD